MMKYVSLAILAMVVSAHAGSTVLTAANIDSEMAGKNSFIKFQAPWWGHCKSMKAAWEDLGTAFEGSSSVLIGDVDCTVETELASTYSVSGYPTIKYFTTETDEKGDSYSGGRDFDSLKKFVEETLEKKCEASDPSTCSEKEQKFITKMADKDQTALTKELTRLTGMKEKKMKREQKSFLLQRIAILTQLTSKEEL